MRQRPPSESTILRVIAFLKDLKLKCNGELDNINTTDLQVTHGISKSTFSSCKHLGIVSQDKGVLKWLKGEVNKEMGLMLLNFMLEKSPKVLKADELPGISDLFTAVMELTERMAQYTAENQKSLKSPKINSDNQFFDLLKAVTTGHYANYDFVTPYEVVNDTILKATQDLFNKYKSIKHEN